MMLNSAKCYDVNRGTECDRSCQTAAQKNNEMNRFIPYELVTIAWRIESAQP